MRLFFLSLAFIGLGGCETISHRAPERHFLSAKCKLVAQSREQDAAANGYEPDIVAAVFEGTYADCVKWYATHPDQ